MHQPLIITAALVGAEVTREHTPYLPITPAEIAAAAISAAQAGASIVHLHMRNDDGSPSQDAARFAETAGLIREQSDVIIQVSTGGAVGMSPEDRLQSIFTDPRPDMATFSTGSLNFGDEIFANPAMLLDFFAKTFIERGIKPEIEVFDTGMIGTAMRLVKKGLLKLPLHFDFVMGVPGGVPGTIKHLQLLTEMIPENCTWTVAGVGSTQLTLSTAAILLGGHARVGLEDNIYYRKGELAEGSTPFVSRLVRLAGELGRPVATPAEARRILGIPAFPV